MKPTSRFRAAVCAPLAALATLAALALVSPASAANGPASANASNAVVAANQVAPQGTRLVHRDPAHDVQRTSLSSENLRPAPKREDADIRTAKARHEGGKVVLMIRTRSALPARRFLVVGTIRTPDRTYEVSFGRLFGESGVHLSRGSGAREVACDGLAAERVAELERVRIVVPTSCIGTPRRVKIGIGAVVATEERIFADDGLAKEIVDDLTRSHWLMRG